MSLSVKGKLTSRKPFDGKCRSYELDEQTISEVVAEAARYGRSKSYMLQLAWRISRGRLAKLRR